jgi:hypothetical protein
MALRASESEGVGEVLLQVFPELCSLVLVQWQKAVVESLELLILFDNLRVRSVGSISLPSAFTTTIAGTSIPAASTSAFAATLWLSVSILRSILTLRTAGTYTKVLAPHGDMICWRMTVNGDSAAELVKVAIGASDCSCIKILYSALEVRKSGTWPHLSKSPTWSIRPLTCIGRVSRSNKCAQVPIGLMASIRFRLALDSSLAYRA